MAHTTFGPALLIACTLLTACAPSERTDEPRAQVSGAGDAARATALNPELNLAPDPRALVDSARTLMLADSNVALVTIDSAGQPRVRTTKAFIDPPDSAHLAAGVTVWIMTRLSTRKIAQMRAHPQVTLYFNDDASTRYATVMGTATIHTDPGHPRAKAHWDVRDPGEAVSGYRTFFWPDFPRDFVMIEVTPRWIEYIGPGIPAHADTWRPQAVVFSERR